MQCSSKIVNTQFEHDAVCTWYFVIKVIFPARFLPFRIVADVIL